MMEILYTHCAGIDVHKKTVVVCCRTPDPQGKPRKQTRTFTTMTADLLRLSDWLTSLAITHVAMESTGEFWKPVYTILEPTFTVLVVNAQHIKNVPGRKTDVKDADWIAELLAHGLVRGSFIPPLPQRDLRDLTRQRTNLVRERATVVNRLQKVLEWANLKLAVVATDVLGVSARAMLEALIGGQHDPAVLANLAKGRMRSKRAELEQALEGYVRDHHRFLIAKHLIHVDFLDGEIADFDTEISNCIAAQSGPHAPAATQPIDETCHGVREPDASAALSASGPSDPGAPTSLPPLTWEEAVTLWDEIPGIGRRVAEQLVAEVGTDMRHFASAAHLASWAKLCPGNHESAGKRYSGKTGKGNVWLRSTLIQAAHAAVRTKDTYLAAFYARLVARRGKKKAIVAVAHKLLTIAYTLLTKREQYREPGITYLDERRKDQLLARMQRRIERLGYTVSLQPQEGVAA
jgi:transposase